MPRSPKLPSPQQRPQQGSEHGLGGNGETPPHSRQQHTELPSFLAGQWFHYHFL